MSSEFTQQLREFIARLRDVELRVGKVADAAGDVAQRLSMTAAPGGGSPPPAMVFPGYCGCTGGFPVNITLHDPVFGNLTIVYDAVNIWWKGTATGLSYIGGPVGCANKTLSITYTYVPCSYLSWDWKRINATGCPDPTGIATNYTDISGGGVTCSPFADSITYFTGTYTPMDKLYGNVNQTFLLS